jgi:hypothetical protein
LRREQVEPLVIARREQLVPQAAASKPRLLATRHRPERQIAGAARQRFRYLTHQQQVGGAGEQEPAGGALAVDGPLHGAQQIRLALHLGQCDRLGAADQRVGVAASGVHDIQVVQRQVTPFAGREIHGQGALAGLACARDHHCGHDAETVGERAGDHPGERRGIHGVHDNHSRRGLPALTPAPPRASRSA